MGRGRIIRTTAAAVLGLLILCGCERKIRAIIDESLAADNPTLVDAPVGRPPVPPDALMIVPTGMAPTATTAVQPDCIEPKMDEVYRTRWMPTRSKKGQPADTSKDGKEETGRCKRRGRQP